ncbi:MAG: hypothetical protein MUP17_05140 [candidate division Zixibacteria bacterium]|nr:hypothetical protein [candidate division Zixibacteria bacterium]
MNKDFALFQSEFKKWQKLFGLTGYKVYFKYEPLDSSYASISVNQDSMVATVRLNSKVSDEARPYKDVKESAKHEAIHLLIGKLEEYGHYRYSSKHEIDEASEELTVKLESLIP